MITTRADYQNLNVKDEYDTIHTILGRNASIGRFGDGELRICNGGRTKPQPFDKKLKERLMEILTSDHFDFLIGVPRVLGRKDDYPARKHWENFFSQTKNLALLDPYKQYFSSFISRKESAPGIINKRYWDLVGLIWQGRDIVVVQGDHYQFTDACELTDEFFCCCSVNQVLGPQRDAFAHYEEILKEVCKFPKDYLIVISLGCAATVLAYDLYEKGYQALDVGRLAMHHVRVMEDWQAI